MSIRLEHQKTFPITRIAETLLMFLRLRGGSDATMDAELTYGPLADYFGLTDQNRKLARCDYYDNDLRVGFAWDNEVRVASKTLKDDGYLISTTHFGQLIWRLTASGAERADFWLVRMTDKTNALNALTVDTQLAEP